MLRAAAVSIGLIAMFAAPAAAADGPHATPQARPLAAAIAQAAHDAAVAGMPSWAFDRPDRRPLALPALYAGYAAAETMDVISTRRAIAAGASEGNPIIHGGNTGAMIAVKAAAGASTIFFSERAWKKNRVGAILLMVGLDSATSAIAAHNLQIARR